MQHPLGFAPFIEALKTNFPDRGVAFGLGGSNTMESPRESYDRVHASLQ